MNWLCDSVVSAGLIDREVAATCAADQHFDFKRLAQLVIAQADSPERVAAIIALCRDLTKQATSRATLYLKSFLSSALPALLARHCQLLPDKWEDARRAAAELLALIVEHAEAHTALAVLHPTLCHDELPALLRLRLLEEASTIFRHSQEAAKSFFAGTLCAAVQICDRLINHQTCRASDTHTNLPEKIGCDASTPAQTLRQISTSLSVFVTNAEHTLIAIDENAAFGIFRSSFLGAILSIVLVFFQTNPQFYAQERFSDVSAPLRMLLTLATQTFPNVNIAQLVMSEPLVTPCPDRAGVLDTNLTVVAALFLLARRLDRTARADQEIPLLPVVFAPEFVNTLQLKCLAALGNYIGIKRCEDQPHENLSPALAPLFRDEIAEICSAEYNLACRKLLRPFSHIIASLLAGFYAQDYAPSKVAALYAPAFARLALQMDNLLRPELDSYPTCSLPRLRPQLQPLCTFYNETLAVFAQRALESN